MPKVSLLPPALLLVRHGKAEEEHPLGDSARGLTPDGRAEFRDHAQALSKLCSARSILTSPLVRAVQTAELLALALKQDRVGVREELAPRWRATSKILEMCLELPPGTALVGHNPSLSEVAAELLGLGELPFKFKKGGALALRRKGKTFELIWFAAPGESLLKKLPD